jgi:hypothetical protein
VATDQAAISLPEVQLPLAEAWEYFCHWVLPMADAKSTKPGSNKSRKNNRTSVPYFLIGFGAPAGICRREFFMMAFSFWQLALSF